MRVQSKSQFRNLRELLNSQLIPELIKNLDELVDKFDSQKTLNDILYQCCEEVYGVSPEDIHEKSRKRNIVDARGMFITFLFLADGNLTWQRIAQQFDQDHATAIHCTRKFCELYGTDGEYQFNANQFFETLEKYGYNCNETKKLLQTPKFKQLELNLKLLRLYYQNGKKVVGDQTLSFNKFQSLVQTQKITASQKDLKTFTVLCQELDIVKEFRGRKKEFMITYQEAKDLLENQEVI